MFRFNWVKNFVLKKNRDSYEFLKFVRITNIEGGVSGHCLNFPSGMLLPKLRHILGSLAFSEFFLVEKRTLPRSNHFFENTMGNPFFDFLKYWPKRSKKKFRIEIWTFSFQICFKNQFWTSGSGQTENTRICVYVYFQFDHFPKSKIDFQSRFKMRMSIFLF